MNKNRWKKKSKSEILEDFYHGCEPYGIPVKKPLWIRLKQWYKTWRANSLHRLGICSTCGWRERGQAQICVMCYQKEFGGIL